MDETPENEQYAVLVSVLYEGMHEAFCGTLDEIRDWLPASGYSSWDMTLYSTNAPSIESLFKNTA